MFYILCYRIYMYIFYSMEDGRVLQLEELGAYQVPPLHFLVGIQRCKWTRVSIQLPSLNAYEVAFPEPLLETFRELTFS